MKTKLMKRAMVTFMVMVIVALSCVCYNQKATIDQQSGQICRLQNWNLENINERNRLQKESDSKSEEIETLTAQVEAEKARKNELYQQLCVHR